MGMSLYDFFSGNATPEQQAGLLGFALNFNEGLGDGSRPVNFGAALAAGAQGMQQGRQQQQDRESQLQMLDLRRKLMNYQVQDAESDFANQQMLRERDARIMKRLQELPQLGGQPADQSTGTPPRPPTSLFAPGDSAQFPETAATMRGLGGLPKLEESGAAQGGQRLPARLPTTRQSASMPRQSATQIAVQQMLALADIYVSEGDTAKATKLYEDATKLQPQVDKIDIAMHEGQPVRVITYKDGREEVSQFGAKPDMTGVDLGGTYEFIDKNRVQPGRVFQKTQTPDSRAVDRRFAARSAAGGAGAEPSMNDETLDFLSERALRGDRAALQNLGRGAQGAANLVALNQRIAEKAKAQGLTGADMAGINADYMGQSAGLRTSGNISARVENAIAEADQLAPLAIDAGRNVARAGLLPFGKAQMMFDTQTNDPALKAFTTANNGLVSAYAGAMARGQKPTVSDYDHAREILAAAQSQKAYEATVAQMQLEMKAASAAPKAVREHLRNEISGRGNGGHNTPTVPNPMAPAPAGQFSVTAPNGKTYSFPDAKSLANYKLKAGIK